MPRRLSISPLPSRNPSPSTSPPAHWVGNQPTGFQNPWPSFTKHGILGILSTRFGPHRNFVPIPETREELVNVRKDPDWGRSTEGWEGGLKATWLGHAGFLVESSCPPPDSSKNVAGTLPPPISTSEPAGSEKPRETSSPSSPQPRPQPRQRRGIRILFDAVFSERTSPVSFLGPKRYSDTPCALADLPDVDLIVTSHNHYDHLDIHTVGPVYSKAKAAGDDIHFFAGLGNKKWAVALTTGFTEEEITDCDWWDSYNIRIRGDGDGQEDGGGEGEEVKGSTRKSGINLTCLPAQHGSGRSAFDMSSTLWCSWIVEDAATGKKLYFAGDTGYQAIGTPTPCPAFKQIGAAYGPLDLALLPIGLFLPRSFMASVHCAPDDSLEIHKDIKSKRSIGMHYGTFRGGLSMHYEDVRVPPRRWREAAEKEGLWGTECGLCDIGETVIV